MPERPATKQPTSIDLQSFWEGSRAAPRRASVRAEMGIPAPLPNRRAVRGRTARARERRERRGQRRHGEADTTLPGRRWHLISASLFRVSCRQKTAEQNYYNWFSRNETVPSWFGCSLAVSSWLLAVSFLAPASPESDRKSVV